MAMDCKICGNKTGNKSVIMKESAFWKGDEFSYSQCPACGCSFLEGQPEDISIYYPKGYYSFNVLPDRNPFKAFLRQKRNKYALFGRGKIGGIICIFFPSPEIKSLSGIGISEDSRIMDVGSGAGRLLHDLREIGFKNLLGIDPYMEKDVNYENGVSVLKKNISAMAGKFDLIMFHHSFEYIGDPFETLRSVERLLASGGICLIRGPVNYFRPSRKGPSLAQVDAPRHFFLHSAKSMEILAAAAGLAVKRIDYSFINFHSYVKKRKNILFGREEAARKDGKFSEEAAGIFEKEANEINRGMKGNQAVFYLERK